MCENGKKPMVFRYYNFSRRTVKYFLLFFTMLYVRVSTSRVSPAMLLFFNICPRKKIEGLLYYAILNQYQ